MSTLLYNPKAAAEELDLPEDIIIEFIGDFVQQAYDFREKIYECLAENGEMKDFYSLVEKLYGVAKNFRIDTVCETLKIIESSTDKAEVMQSLEIFYVQIDELKNKNFVSEPEMKTEKTMDCDYLVLDLPEDSDEDIEMHIHSFRLLGLAHYEQKQFFECISTMEKAYKITKDLCEQQHLRWGNLHLSNISLLTSAYKMLEMPEEAATLKQEAAQISTNFSE